MAAHSGAFHGINSPCTLETLAGTGGAGSAAATRASEGPRSALASPAPASASGKNAECRLPGRRWREGLRGAAPCRIRPSAGRVGDFPADRHLDTSPDQDRVECRLDVPDHDRSSHAIILLARECMSREFRSPMHLGVVESALSLHCTRLLCIVLVNKAG